MTRCAPLAGRALFLSAISLLFPYPSLALRPLNLSDNAGLEEELQGRLRPAAKPAAPAAGTEEVPDLKERARRDWAERFRRYQRLIVERTRGSGGAVDLAPEGALYEQAPDGSLKRTPIAPFVLQEGDRSIAVDLYQEDAVRIPAGERQPLPVGSANHLDCWACIARGWNPLTREHELVEWHLFLPVDAWFPLSAMELLRWGMPGLIRGLEDVRLILSPRTVHSVDLNPEGLRKEWGLRSVTVLSRTEGTQVSTLSSAEAAAFLFHPGYLQQEEISEAGDLVSDPARFMVLRWDDLETSRTLFIPAAGMEEGLKRMSAREFGRKYGEFLLAAPEERGPLESWLARSDVLATVLDLPVQLPLYVKGDRLFWRIVDDLLPRAGADPRLKKIHLIPVLLPTSQWSDVGLILQDPLFDLPAADNPRGLRVRIVEPEAVPALSFTDLLLDIFQARLGVPESERLGAFVFTDPAGRAHLVLFHSA